MVCLHYRRCFILSNNQNRKLLLHHKLIFYTFIIEPHFKIFFICLKNVVVIKVELNAHQNKIQLCCEQLCMFIGQGDKKLNFLKTKKILNY